VAARALYTSGPPPYVRADSRGGERVPMRAEIENFIDEIKQVITLLRRHL
jgi:hypothetical protein